ncbi:MAG: flavodoxin family protein [Ruminococcaceae bacterium]|nr:flavodoxin family protein [Oscillospiraceae bacterium]
MTLLITDIAPSNLQLPTDCKVVTATEERAHCVGCFGCWVKTPGECVIKDDISRHGTDMAQCDRLVIVSRCVYGGYSPAVKRVMDRSIPYIHPYFTTVDGEMHHRRRYDHTFDIRVHFYGDITEGERQTAQKLVEANRVNIYGRSVRVCFHDTPEQIGEVRL